MKKQLFCALGIATILSANAPIAMAADIPPIPAYQTSGDSIIAPYADVIVYKTRIYKGKQQYRRWNETRGYWVDPEWLPVTGS